MLAGSLLVVAAPAEARFCAGSAADDEAPAAALRLPGEAELAALVEATPRCSPARRCVGIHVFVAADAAGTVVDAAWLAGQVTEAQRRFAPIEVSFEVRAASALRPGEGAVVSRRDRDRLGAGRYDEALIQVFVVGSLANVDEPGEIRGVHWRDREDRSRRWIILSKIAGRLVLTHELGHYFGLPHSSLPASVMNKTEGIERPLDERVFHARELKKMRGRLKASLGALRLRSVTAEG